MEMEQMIQYQLDNFVGSRYVIMHLASERGAALNGKHCVVMGHDRRRLAVKLDDGSTFSLKGCNLMPEKDVTPYMPPQGPGVPEAELLRRLADAADFNAADHGNAGSSERDDIPARIAYVREHLAQGRVPPPPRCGDMLLAQEAVERNPMLTMLSVVQPCCHGNGQVDFRRFNTGLVGSGGDCAVCMEPLDPEQRAIGFPCGHGFHQRCVEPWLQSHNTCPTCRFQLAMPGLEYAFMLRGYEEHLTVRLREYFISGSCERCQAMYMETDPLMVVPDPSGGPSRLIPRSQLSPAWPA